MGLELASAYYRFRNLALRRGDYSASYAYGTAERIAGALAAMTPVQALAEMHSACAPLKACAISDSEKAAWEHVYSLADLCFSR